MKQLRGEIDGLKTMRGFSTHRETIANRYCPFSLHRAWGWSASPTRTLKPTAKRSVLLNLARAVQAVLALNDADLYVGRPPRRWPLARFFGEDRRQVVEKVCTEEL